MRVVVRGVSPLIVRTIELSGTVTLAVLHEALRVRCVGGRGLAGMRLPA